MSKLLRAGLRRYFHSSCLWIAVIASMGAGLFSGYMSHWMFYFETVYYMATLLIYAVVISLMIGREFKDGIFRNKIITGHSKGQIYISEVILAVCVTGVMFLLTSIGFALCNREVFTFVPFDMLAVVYFGIVLITLSSVSMAILISSCMSNHVIAAIANIMLILVIFLSAYEIQNLLNQPEMYENIVVEMDEKTGELIETRHSYKNPTYVSGGLRTVLETYRNIAPHGQFLQYEPIFSSMLELYAIEEEEYPFYECFVNGVYAPPTEELKELRYLPLYQIGLILVLLGSGYLIFRKKDFK